MAHSGIQQTKLLNRQNNDDNENNNDINQYYDYIDDAETEANTVILYGCPMSIKYIRNIQFFLILLREDNIHFLYLQMTYSIHFSYNTDQNNVNYDIRYRYFDPLFSCVCIMIIYYFSETAGYGRGKRNFDPTQRTLAMIVL